MNLRVASMTPPAVLISIFYLLAFTRSLLESPSPFDGFSRKSPLYLLADLILRSPINALLLAFGTVMELSKSYVSTCVGVKLV